MPEKAEASKKTLPTEEDKCEDEGGRVRVLADLCVISRPVPCASQNKHPMQCRFPYIFTVALWLSLLPLCGKAQVSLYERYIATYSDMAVEQMERYGVPASITLAQGLLESRAGTSRLATRGNNHFGIKCGGTWKGPYMLMTDDAPNEKFRVYRNARESYEDHSRFLRYGRRYAFLFDLKKTDYKGWARGLKKAGYATSPTYASSLIELIERYNLTAYDKGKRRRHHEEGEREKLQARAGSGHAVRRCNGQYYIVAQAGDTYASLARTMKTKEKKLRQYNDVGGEQTLRQGDIVYLGKKARRADRSLKRRYHVMEEGESLYSISQRYGIRLSSLCKMNPIKDSYHFRVGDEIKIK